MATPITKKAIRHLAKLARLELTPDEEKKLLGDLTNILAHFEDLQKLDAKDVKPMTGGTHLKDVFREDIADETNRGAGVDAFPESKNGFLKIPPVFPAEGAAPDKVLHDGQGSPGEEAT